MSALGAHGRRARSPGDLRTPECNTDVRASARIKMAPVQHLLRVTQTVILAAGSGSRLATARGDVPKPLMTVAGVPLIVHALDHACASGCDEAVIIIGYEGPRVRETVAAMHTPLRLLFLENRDFTAPNGVSLLASEGAAAPTFYLQMVDHLFSDPALKHLSASALGSREAGRVLVDSEPSVHLDLD